MLLSIWLSILLMLAGQGSSYYDEFQQFQWSYDSQQQKPITNKPVIHSGQLTSCSLLTFTDSKGPTSCSQRTEAAKALAQSKSLPAPIGE